MNNKQRQMVYLAMVAGNAVAIALSQQAMVPPMAAHVAGLVSLVLAMVMKEFNAQDPAPPTVVNSGVK